MADFPGKGLPVWSVRRWLLWLQYRKNWPAECNRLNLLAWQAEKPVIGEPLRWESSEDLDGAAMTFLLRPVCWIKGHAELVEQYVELLPLPFLVCSRCGAHAPDEVQMAHYKSVIKELAQ